MTGFTDIDDLRAQHPPRDPEAYEAAYQETSLSGEVAELVYKLRKDAGLSQAALGELVGTSQSAIARVEVLGHKPNLAFVERIAAALGVQLHISAEPLTRKRSAKTRSLANQAATQKRVRTAS
jgi:ribosome-binding protein aMBF1 (putative translation factor)